jgi:hypothetical protein
MIINGDTITKDIPLHPMWTIISAYGSEEDKKNHANLHKEVTGTPEQWAQWYAHKSNKDIALEQQEMEDYDIQDNRSN